MRQEIRQLRQTIAHCPKLALVNGAVFLIAFWRGFRGRGSELAEFFCLALPALLVGFDSLRQVRPRQGAPSAAEIAGSLRETISPASLYVRRTKSGPSSVMANVSTP